MDTENVLFPAMQLKNDCRSSFVEVVIVEVTSADFLGFVGFQRLQRL